MHNPSANEQHVLKNGRATIAVLVGSMSSAYQEGIMRGAAHVAEKNDYNVIGYCGGAVNSTDPLSLVRDRVFGLVDMDLIAGVIGPFSSHLRFLDDHSSQKLINRFSTVPTVNIGSYVQGHSNVITDYAIGFEQLFEHFYVKHQYRHILIMRGPKHHASSNSRTEIYKEMLIKHQLPFDQDAVLYADLNRLAAKISFEKFLDQVGKPVEVVIAVNDNQALGVIDACKERGISVPEEIAVIGSMDTLEGAFASPALTSIQEPLFELGSVAAQALIDQIEGKSQRVDIYVPTSLVIRQSCGCLPEAHFRSNKEQCDLTKALGDIKNNDLIFKGILDYFESKVVPYKGGIIRDDVASVIHLYQQAVHEKDFDGFLKILQCYLQESVKTEEIILWLELTDRIQFSALQYLEQDKDAHGLVGFIGQLISLKNKIEKVAINFQRFEAEYYLNYFRTIVNNLNSSFDLTRIKEYAVDILNLSELHISLFNELNSEPLYATNIVSVRNNQFMQIENKEFLAKKLLPDGLIHYQDRFTLMVFPLSFRKKALGFMTLNLSNRKGTAFENLRAIISAALKNEILIQDLKKEQIRFSEIAHSSSNWLWETDKNNEFTYCSNSTSEIIGYPPALLMNKKINEFNVGKEGCFINRMHSHEVIIDFECWYRHHNGNVICLLISAKPIFINQVFTGYRGLFEDVTEKKLQAEKIKNLANLDILTGLPNRKLFQHKLTEVIEHCRVENKKCAIICIDVDYFKHVNDTLGHEGGDLLLVQLTQRLQEALSKDHILARLGGDEFVIIVPDIQSEENVVEAVVSIFKHIKAPILINDKPIYSTLSLGVSLYPNDGDDVQTLLQSGDNAMYQAKSQGRNGYVFYDKFLEQKNILRNKYEDILREAILKQQFILYYQPQVSVNTGNIVGFEALVRIQNKEQEIIAPNNFIPLAEELGLIGQVDELIFEEGCRQYGYWRKNGHQNIRLSINLSALQLRNEKLLNTYIQIMKAHHVDPKDIQIEITENALIENEQLALTILQGFKDYGLSIALDDFGTGYSSLNCINLYPIDTIKIDRTFVKDAVNNPKNKAVIQGMVLIASSLNLKIIAEGVETVEQYEFIKQLGCHEIQGYYFYKPCPAAQVDLLLQQRVVTTLK